jgi:hypothetical protein
MLRTLRIHRPRDTIAGAFVATFHWPTGIAMNWEPSARRRGGNARHYPQERGARFVNAVDASREMPRMTQLACIRIRYLTWKLRALCSLLRRLRAGQRLEYKKSPRPGRGMRYATRPGVGEETKPE